LGHNAELESGLKNLFGVKPLFNFDHHHPPPAMSGISPLDKLMAEEKEMAQRLEEVRRAREAFEAVEREKEREAKARKEEEEAAAVKAAKKAAAKEAREEKAAKKAREAEEAAKKAEGPEVEEVAPTAKKGKRKAKAVEEEEVMEIDGSEGPGESAGAGEATPKQWVVDPVRGSCRQCDSRQVPCKWPAKGRGKNCEGCYNGHVVCIPNKKAKAEPAPGSAGPVIEELMGIRGVLEEIRMAIEDNSALLAHMSMRVRRGNKCRLEMDGNLDAVTRVAEAWAQSVGLASGSGRGKGKDEVARLVERVSGIGVTGARDEDLDESYDEEADEAEEEEDEEEVDREVMEQ
jgi:hypothetical protein